MDRSAAYWIQKWTRSAPGSLHDSLRACIMAGCVSIYGKTQIRRSRFPCLPSPCPRPPCQARRPRLREQPRDSESGSPAASVNTCELHASPHPASATHDGALTTLLSRMILAAWHLPRAARPQAPRAWRRIAEDLRRAHAKHAMPHSARLGAHLHSARPILSASKSPLANGLPPRLPPPPACLSFAATV